jgi:hypothetical protein
MKLEARGLEVANTLADEKDQLSSFLVLCFASCHVGFGLHRDDVFSNVRYLMPGICIFLRNYEQDIVQRK